MRFSCKRNRRILALFLLLILLVATVSFRQHASYQVESIVPNYFSDLSDKCSGSSPCISFGTPYFGRWSGWIPIIRLWVHSAQAACGFPCTVISSPDLADAVLFHGRDLRASTRDPKRSSRQHWVYVNMESPMVTRRVGYDVSSDPKYRHYFNWTLTTMRSSSIPIHYYGSWVYMERPLVKKFYEPRKKRYMAYTAISNCNTTFSNRTAKVAHLQRYMEVHVYGDCGDRPLVRDRYIWHNISEQYRFYLSFENAFCMDYITEKFHKNGLDSQAIPVVFGGLSRADYERVSPSHSFVYALDFYSMHELANHLKALAADEDLYASFFMWKRHYQPAWESASILCAVCARLHRDRSTSVADLDVFYNQERNCRPKNFTYLV